MRLKQWFEEFRGDVSYAIRQLRASPGFTLVATLTLALGIGANSAMFALADAALFRPLPFRDPDRLVIVDEWGPQQAARSRIELLNFREWAKQSRTFESMAAIWIPGTGGGPTLTGADGTPEIVPGQIGHAPRSSTFSASGRFSAERSCRRTRQQTRVSSVLSEGFWRRRFAADPSLVGRDITLNGRPITVIGIVPPTSSSRPDSRLFRKACRSAACGCSCRRRGAAIAGDARGQCGMCRLLQVVGRMKPGSVDRGGPVGPDAPGRQACRAKR